MAYVGSDSSSQGQDGCTHAELMFEPQPVATPKNDDERLPAGGRVNQRIAPEELLALPASVRNKPLAGPRRRDLFSALRRRQGQAKRRRRRVREGRRSEEVLAGLLTRAGRNGSACKPGHQPSSTSNWLALLRADRPRPVVQHLHRPAAVGLGRAMGMAAGDQSDLDSGISEWGSGDDGDTAAFQALLEEEARAVRRRHQGASPLPSPSTHSTHDSSPRQSPRIGDGSSPVSAVRRTRPRAEFTASAPNLQSCSPAGCYTPGNMVEPTHTPVDPPTSGLERSLSTQTVPPKSRQPPTETDEHQRRISTVSGSVHDTRKKRSEGVQCSGPPVDQGVQTSSLRLPRRSIAVRDRVLQARSSSFDSPESDRGVDQNHGKPSPMTGIGNKPAGNRLVCSKAFLGSPNGSTRTRVTWPEGRAGQMHVRVGLEGLEDADRGQHPTIWAVARGENAAGPIMMLPLEENDGSGEDAPTRQMRKFLRVTDITGGPGDVGSKNAPRSTLEEHQGASFAHSPGNGGAGVCGRSSQEDADNSTHDGNALDVHHQTSDLDSLKEGLGSLGERLAGVGARFDQLDEEFCHDQQEIERCQREAQEEVKMATKYLEGVQAHRTLHPIRKVPPPPQVPYWRSRPGTNGILALETQALRIETASPTIDETPHFAHGRGSSNPGGSDGGFGCESAANQAEQELREARAILESIEKELRSDADNAASPSAAAAPPPMRPIVVMTTTFGSEAKKEAVGSVVPVRRRCNTDDSQPQHRQYHLAVDARLREEKQVPEPSAGRVNRSNGGKIWSVRPSRTSRLWFSQGGGRREGAKSIGTAIAHFPTAVAASKSKPRGRHATKRAWA